MKNSQVIRRNRKRMKKPNMPYLCNMGYMAVITIAHILGYIFNLEYPVVWSGAALMSYPIFLHDKRIYEEDDVED